MSNVLIAYATWAGSTKSVAEEIASVLRKNSHETTVISAKESVNVNDFDAVILGTSIHMSKTVKSFRSFIKKHSDVLSSKPIALFVVCANMMEDTEENRKETLEWLNKAIDKYAFLKPVSVGLFGGGTFTQGEDYDNLNIFLRKIITIMDKNLVQEYGTSDFRDLSKVREWAKKILPLLLT